MHTHYLGLEEVDAYCRDFITRLKSLDGDLPTLWCPIGPSGEALAVRMLTLSPDLAQRVSLLPVDYDRDNDAIKIKDGDLGKDAAGKRVLVLDSSVHSGSTMGKVVQAVAAAAPAGICSYSLVVKRSAAFVPSFWGVTINDHDRAYFLLDELPNNRLNKKDPFIQIRKLTKQDLQKQSVACELQSLDRITWSDRYYNMEARGRDHVTYVMEACAQILGYVTLSFHPGALEIDEVAVNASIKGKGYGGALMRWAETSARQACVEEIRLWGVDSQVDYYEKLGYKKLGREMQLDDGTYFFMRKRVLYHI